MNLYFRKCLALLLLAAASAVAAPSDAPTRLPETTSTGFGSVLSEETSVGVTGRPEWTGARRFPGSRVYLQRDPWQVGMESWWRLKHKRDGTLRHRLLEEVGIGLPGRLQLDLYNQIEGDNTGAFHYQSFNVEMRWALADWGQLWGNPTLYLEYKFADKDRGPDVYEFKLLLGDQVVPRWHWAVNFVWEAETGGDREQEFQVTGGLSYSLIDGKLGIGVEAFYDHDTVKGQRGNPDHLVAVGPSMQLRFTQNLQLSLNCMFGANRSTERQIGYLVLGYNFGSGASGQQGYSPVSGRRN